MIVNNDLEIDNLHDRKELELVVFGDRCWSKLILEARVPLNKAIGVIQHSIAGKYHYRTESDVGKDGKISQQIQVCDTNAGDYRPFPPVTVLASPV